jgi:hypothetical protein
MIGAASLRRSGASRSPGPGLRVAELLLRPGRLGVRLSATAVDVLDGPRVVARHERAAGKYAEILTLDHYLEVLKYKPGALPGATALAQAKVAGVFTPVHSGTGTLPGASAATPPEPGR